MTALLLLAGLAFAEPEIPTVPAPDGVEVVEVDADLITEGGDGVVRLEPEPERPPLGWRDRVYFWVGDALLHMASVAFIPAHQGYGVTLIVDKFLEVVALLCTGLLGMYYTRRKKKAPGAELAEMLDDGTQTGPIEDAKASAKERIRRAVKAEVDTQISTLVNLQRTEIAVLRSALADYLTADQIDEVVEIAEQTPGHPKAEAAHRRVRAYLRDLGTHDE